MPVDGEMQVLYEKIQILNAELAKANELITECDGVECTKHDTLVRIAIKDRQKAEAERDNALTQVATLKVQLSEEYRDWMKEQCNEDCTYGHRLFAEKYDEVKRLRAALRIFADGGNWEVCLGLRDLLIFEWLHDSDPCALAQNALAEESRCMVGGHPPDCRGHIKD